MTFPSTPLRMTFPSTPLNLTNTIFENDLFFKN